MITAYGVGRVARWCGVGSQAVSAWLRRHPGATPAPSVRILTGTGVTYGWDAASRPQWERFAAARKPGRPAGR
jgi:hypothetical protein